MQTMNGVTTERAELRPAPLPETGAGPPMLPGPYNNNYQLVQGPGYVAILVEMIHDARIIPIDGRPHLPQTIRQWLGDPRGHWEGNTLVVETTNFTDKTSDVGAGLRGPTFRGSDDRMRLIERFTRVDPNTIRYQFTVDDPTAFTKQWAATLRVERRCFRFTPKFSLNTPIICLTWPIKWNRLSIQTRPLSNAGG